MMKLSTSYKRAKLCIAVCLVQTIALAQAIGSSETINGYMAIAANCTHASTGENIYIGPGTYLINGTWQIYSKNVWISPNAVFSGSGTIRFFNPSVAGAAPSPTLIDGNNSSNFINVSIRLDNASDMILTDITPTAAMTTAGWNNVSGNASLSVGADFNFAVDNGDAVLGDYDMTLSNAATLSNYREQRHVITAGGGHLVRQNFTGSFIFPVGMAAGDYTPAQITNTIASTMHVNVTDYDGVIAATFPGSIVQGRDGIDRGWNIYADNATGNSLINLQHNDGTEGYVYDDMRSFVTRFTGVKPNSQGDNTSLSYWESNTPAAGTGTGLLTTGAAFATASERSRTYTTFATSASDNISWYSKASDLMDPLPVSLTSFSVKIKTCGTVQLDWQTAQEQDLMEFEIEQSRDGASFSKLASAIPKNLNEISRYSITASQNEDVGYYRLKIKEQSGKIIYSNIVSLMMSCNVSSIKVYPVPFSNTLTIVTKENEVKEIVLFDASGKRIGVAYTGVGNMISIDGTGIAPGIYIIQIKKKDGTNEHVRVMKK